MKHPAALARQLRKHFLKPAQFIARMQLGFRVCVRLQQFKVRNLLERDDFISPRLIDNQVSGNVEQVGPAMLDAHPVRCRPGPGQDFRDRVIKILARSQNPPQSGAKRSLVRKDDCLEPIQLGTSLAQQHPLMVTAEAPPCLFSYSHCITQRLACPAKLGHVTGHGLFHRCNAKIFGAGMAGFVSRFVQFGQGSTTLAE